MNVHNNFFKYSNKSDKKKVQEEKTEKLKLLNEKLKFSALNATPTKPKAADGLHLDADLDAEGHHGEGKGLKPLVEELILQSPFSARFREYEMFEAECIKGWDDENNNSATVGKFCLFCCCWTFIFVVVTIYFCCWQFFFSNFSYLSQFAISTANLISFK